MTHLLCHDALQCAAPILVVGPAYSGKSDFAPQALDRHRTALVIGTADTRESAFALRLTQLRQGRPSQWRTEDAGEDLARLFDCTEQQILVDSLNLWLAQLILEGGKKYDFPDLQAHLWSTLDQLSSTLGIADKSGKRLVLVSAEIGAGTVPEQREARLLRQSTARMNQLLAGFARTVIYLQSGLPIRLK